MTDTHSFQPAGPSRPWTRIAPALLFAALAAAASCGGATESERPPSGAGGAAVSVAAARAEMRDTPAVFEAGGIVRAKLVAAVSSRVLAPVAAVHARPGDRVRAGQPLVELDARQLEADRRRAGAALAAAENGARAAAADVRGADASLQLSRTTRDRIATLFDRRSATAQERDDAEAALRAADARASAARARAAEAAAAVEAARAALDTASIAASYAVVTAPFDAAVSERHVDPGDMAAPGAPLLTLEDARSLQLEVRLDESRAAAIAIGQAVPVRLDAVPDLSIPGRVAEIGRVDPASHTFVVKIDLPVESSFRSGAFGRAAFEGPARRALVVPASAVVRRGQLVFVFTVADGRARLRPISVGQAAADGVEVTAGISSGEMVVTEPPEALVDGAAVSTSGAGR